MQEKQMAKNARNLFVINWLAINQTITKMLSALRHVNTNTFAAATVAVVVAFLLLRLLLAETTTSKSPAFQDLWACNLFL